MDCPEIKMECKESSLENIKNIQLKEYIKLGNNNQLFYIKIFIKDKLIGFQVEIKDDISETKYINHSTLEDFYKLNGLFKRYSSTKEIFKALFNELEDNEIIKENNNKLKLCFIFEFRKKDEEIALLLNPELDVKKVIYNLWEKIKEINALNKELNNQKLVNEKLKEELSAFKKKVENKNNYLINNEINQLDNKYKLLPFNLNLNEYQDIIFIAIIIIIFAFFISMISLNLKIQNQFVSINDTKRSINETINQRLNDYFKENFNDYINKNEFPIKIETLKPDDLKVYNGENDKYFIRIKKNGIQYGPYRMYKSGKYLVIYNGFNLLKGIFDAYDDTMSNPLIPINKLKKEEMKAIYIVDIPPSLVSGIEFRLTNNDNDDIFVTKISVYEIVEKIK